MKTKTELLADIDRVTAERDAALLQVETITDDRDAEKRMKAKARIQRDVQTAKAADLQERLTAADERADVLSPGSALGDVHLERLRQIDVENRSPVDDDDYSLGQLAYAAAGYAQGSVPAQQVQGCLRPSYWPWHPRWWKPGSPRRMLVKAAALILAEIERIDRSALKSAEVGGDEPFCAICSGKKTVRMPGAEFVRDCPRCCHEEG